jgi:uncharacterized membrane protein YcaP (DUF421 family)
MPPADALFHLRALLGDGLTLLFTALRVSAVYLVLLGLLYASGRRTLGQMTPFDLITLLLLANVVQNAMIGPDDSLLGGLLGAAVLLLVNRTVAASGWLRRKLEGEPVMLVYGGRVLSERLRREGVSERDLEAAVREHGLADLSGVATAVLEMDGTISVIAKDQGQLRRLRRVRSSRNR